MESEPFDFWGVSSLDLGNKLSTNVVAESFQGNSHCYDFATLSRCSIEVLLSKELLT
jgi:hypothetical protein